MKLNDERLKATAADWFASILDAYEKGGGLWASKTDAANAVAYYTYYRETGDPQYLEQCEIHLKNALPQKK